MNVSVSDIQNYLRCRRKWDLESTSRQSLRTKRNPKPFLDTGSAVHHALDAHTDGREPLVALEEYRQQRLAEEISAYEDIVGATPSDSELAGFHEAIDLAADLVTQYFKHYGDNPLESAGLKMVATEVSFKIPLAEDLNFIGTFDGIAVDIETGTKVWLVENKTLSQKVNTDYLQFSNQLVGYAWAFQVLTGSAIEGVLYNGIVKKVIVPPKVLKNGALSVDKQQPTTLQYFLDALDAGGRDAFDPKYQSYIEFLEKSGVDRFFIREPFHFSQTQLENWGNTLRTVADEMAGDPVIYPTFRREGCSDCWVRDLCESQERGGNVEQLKQDRYKTAGYGTSISIDRVTPDVVVSVSDLLESLRKPRE